MKNSTMLIKSIKNEENLVKLKELVSIYIDYGYSLDVLLEVVKDFEGNKRNLVLNLLVDASLICVNKIAKSKYLGDNDRVYVIKKLINDNKYVSTIAYGVMIYIDDPKKYFNDDEIKKVLRNINIKEIIDKYGVYFAKELLNRPDYYYLLKVKKELPNEVLNQIYFKSFRFKSDYLNVIAQLNEEDKKDYVKTFLKLGCTNYEIAFDIIKNKYYQEEDYVRLLKVIGHYAPANIIYDILMNEILDKKEIDMLEKALLKTGNIEYISYYYFFKDREKFILLFGSALLFLSFVTLNKESFNNLNILDVIINKIKEEEVLFKDSINCKINAAYYKKTK